ncbi:MAG: phosphomannomutase [Proteobacteria bacterium]|nr:phosphomannomutase [Pseudomonadota bacterium]
MAAPTKLPAFKAYDIRGKMPHELNPAMAYHIGRGLARITGAKTAVLGMDSRLTSPELLAAAAAGLAAEGAKPSSLGLCGTEEVYHAAGSQGYGLGIMVTASHNPAEYNGFKLIRAGGQPFSHDADLPALEAFTRSALAAGEPTPATFPQPATANHRQAYLSTLSSIADTTSIQPLNIVLNAGNGAAGPTVEALLAHLPQLTATKLHFMPDGTFPNGLPNPLLPTNREETARAVKQSGAALGIAWDGDFDRCFFYDESGEFINNYYICALLAEALLAKEKSTVVHDPRLYRDTVQTITENGGTPIISKVGHGYIKPLMRQHHAIFGGEISGHFYFRDFFYCDTGMLPALLMLELMGRTNKTLSQLVAEHASRAPASDEINFRTTTPASQILTTLQSHYQPLGATFSRFDGLEVSFPTWRANIRTSSNEPLLRLNVEAASPTILTEKLNEISSLITSQGATPANH